MLDGFENYERAVARGKGVLLFAGHLGGWELSAFMLSLYGHPMHAVMRSMDNIYLDRMIRYYRTMHGNNVVDKDEFVRGLLMAMKAGEVVGLLMDTNMTPPQGSFRRFLWYPSMHCNRTGENCTSLRCRSRSYIRDLGLSPAQISPAL